MVLSCSSMHACVRPSLHTEALLTRYLAEYLTHFHQITMHYGTEINPLNFRIKRSQFEATVE